MTQAIDLEHNPALAFGFYQEFATLDAGWSTFPRHYLLYASTGVFHLEVAQAQWLLPPQRAAWIAADVPIRVSIRAPVTCCSVLYARDSIAPPVPGCRVFALSPLARASKLLETANIPRPHDPHTIFTAHSHLRAILSRKNNRGVTRNRRRPSGRFESQRDSAHDHSGSAPCEPPGRWRSHAFWSHSNDRGDT